MPWKGPATRLNLSARAWKRLREIYKDQLGRSSLRQRAAYGLMSRYLSLLEKIQPPLKDGPPAPPPLFILGHWRSGTTMLHELLCCDPQFAYPSTYACMNPQHFRSTERGAQALSGDKAVTRPMDQMKISAASPQEDEFALLCLGARSPYEAVLFPGALRRALEAGEWDGLSEAERGAWCEALTRFIAGVQAQHPGKRLILKSPPHSWKVPVLRKLFPGAQFVYIVRNPFDVVASTRHMWQSLYGIYALTPPPWPDPLPDVAEFLARLHRRLRDDLPLAQDHVVVRFEELSADRLGEARRIYQALNMSGLEIAEPRFAAHIRATSQHRKNELALSEAERALVAEVCAHAFHAPAPPVDPAKLTFF